MRIQRKLLVAGALTLAAAAAVPTMMAAGAGTITAGGQQAGLATVLAGLSVQQLAGQRVIYSYSGLNPPASLISLIQHGQAAGVIFFKQNISSRAQIAAVIKRLE